MYNSSRRHFGCRSVSIMNFCRICSRKYVIGKKMNLAHFIFSPPSCLPVMKLRSLLWNIRVIWPLCVWVIAGFFLNSYFIGVYAALCWTVWKTACAGRRRPGDLAAMLHVPDSALHKAHTDKRSPGDVAFRLFKKNSFNDSAHLGAGQEFQLVCLWERIWAAVLPDHK